jgi:probable rRNA maturation factor
MLGSEAMAVPKEIRAIDVQVTNAQDHLSIERGPLVELARHVLRREGRDRALISIVLVDSATIHGINRDHLGHDWPTDVLSFPLSTSDLEVLSGELVVSAELAVEVAAANGARPFDELALYIVHGLLHLCGYHDDSTAGVHAMRRREDELLSECGMCNPFHLARRARASSKRAGSGKPDRKRTAVRVDRVRPVS